MKKKRREQDFRRRCENDPECTCSGTNLPCESCQIKATPAPPKPVDYLQFLAVASSAVHTNVAEGIQKALPVSAAQVFMVCMAYFPSNGTLKYEIEANMEDSPTIGTDDTWLDTSLANNGKIIGAHFHEGDAVTNGPVMVSLCGESPLPDVLYEPKLPGIGPCNSKTGSTTGSTVVGKTVTQVRWDTSGDFKFNEEAYSATSQGKPLPLGTLDTAKFGAMLADCYAKDNCEEKFYFNIHTPYSFNLNTGAYGVARGQMYASSLPSSGRPRRPGCWENLQARKAGKVSA